MGRDPSWFNRRYSDLENALKIDSNNERIAALGEFMSIASHGEMDDQQKTIFNQAQAALLATPGHAEYYQDRILEAQEHLKSPGGGTTWADYHKEVRNGFQILPHLHSPEGLRVLGEMLTNDWVLPGNETKAPSEQVPILSESATVALAVFPLKDKPFNDRVIRKNYENAHAAWQLWYEQIKSGKRTFRFEGDPTEYDLHGPASGQKLTNISRNQKKDDQRKADNKPTIIGAILASFTLLAAIVWFFLKRQTISDR